MKKMKKKEEEMGGEKEEVKLRCQIKLIKGNFLRFDNLASIQCAIDINGTHS